MDRRDLGAHRGPAAGADRRRDGLPPGDHRARTSSCASSSRSGPIHQTVIRRIAPVMQRLGGIEQNRERLASLGTMAAGLAHELNNPAAAARRAAAQLPRRSASCSRRS